MVFTKTINKIKNWIKNWSIYPLLYHSFQKGQEKGIDWAKKLKLKRK